MYPASSLLFVLGLGIGLGIGIALGAYAFRRWVRNEARAEAKRIFDAMTGYAQDVVAVKLATEPPPPSTVRDMAMSFGKLQTELEDIRARLEHVSNGGEWDDSVAARAAFTKVKPPKKH